MTFRNAVEDIPSTIRQKVEGILKYGKITRDEYEVLEDVLGEEEVADKERNIVGSFVAQWLKEDTGEAVEWGGDRKEEVGETADTEIEHIPSKTDVDKSFLDIVKKSKTPTSSTPKEPSAEQDNTRYEVRGREGKPATAPDRPDPEESEGPSVYLPKTKDVSSPPSPSASLPGIPNASEKTEALPQVTGREEKPSIPQESKKDKKERPKTPSRPVLTMKPLPVSRLPSGGDKKGLRDEPTPLLPSSSENTQDVGDNADAPDNKDDLDPWEA